MNRNQRGFTIPELLIVIAVIGIIGGAMAPLVFQITNITGYGSDKMIAVHEIQHTSHWFAADVRAAKAATGDSGSLNLVLHDDSQIDYLLSGSELWRTETASTTLLARNVTMLDFSVTDNIVAMNITTAPVSKWQASDNGTYYACMRQAE
jgi:prepilin-type N-terminal cleavage/methylation domain-containing protein